MGQLKHVGVEARILQQVQISCHSPVNQSRLRDESTNKVSYIKTCY